jgi:signal transduction histidine kinase
MISVLLIDTEPDHLNIAKEHLERSGSFAVDVCPSAHDALRLLSGKRYDAVVSDYDLPVMTGLDLLKKLKAEGDPTPFIMLTGSGPEHVIIEAFHAGASYYLKKHPDRESQFQDLSHKIRLAVKKHHDTQKMDLFMDILRHDLLNKLSAVSGYTELIRANSTDPKNLAFLGKQQILLASVREQIIFSRDFQNIGIEKPRWQSLGSAIRQAVALLPADIIQPEYGGTDGIEVFADPLLVKVFYNLMENSLRHGRTASRIRFSCHEQSAGCIVVYEDDGCGIADSDKEMVFLKGKGKNTGLGLFLIREILALTGITIRENGISGKGARFEMLVPADRCRAREDKKG